MTQCESIALCGNSSVDLVDRVCHGLLQIQRVNLLSSESLLERLIGGKLELALALARDDDLCAQLAFSNS